MKITEQPRLHQDWINPHALGIVKALQKKGFITYLVGGCVRDLLLGIHPKDFDIGTTALPEEVKQTIYRAYLIGKRFRLVLVRRDEHQFEVATFRKQVPDVPNSPTSRTSEEVFEADADLPPLGDNVFGSPEEDAQRRDFTINGLFYDPVADNLIDYAEGLKDLEKRWIRMIGEPNARLEEDPIRILRAIRLKHLIGFAIEETLRDAIVAKAHTLAKAVLPRKREELLKFLRLKNPSLPFIESFDLGVLDHVSPTLAKKIKEHPDQAEDFFDLLSLPAPSGSTPLEMFGHLVHAYVRGFYPDLTGNIKSRELLEDDEIGKWMQDELGMFKSEMSIVAKALHFESVLDRVQDFQRKGERRQLAALANESFPLGVSFAEKDLSLDAGSIYFWKERLEWSQDKIQEAGVNEFRERKKRRPRRRRRVEG